MMNMERNELHNEAMQLLKQLIAIPSFSKEEQATATLIGSYLNGKRILTHRLYNNVWAFNKYYDIAKPTILLNSHHDTVKPAPGYSNDPFTAMEQDGKLFGLGSNDAGGPLVALLATFLHYYDRNDLRYNLVFAATAEEEVSGAYGISAILDKLGNIDCAIVGEPTQMQLATAEKGLLVVDCIAHGRAGHAANSDGDNAIYKAISDIQWFQNYQFPRVSPLLGPVKMGVTVVNAGKQHNVIPDTCLFTIDCRINEQYTHDEVLEVIQQNISSTATPRSTRLRSTSIAADHPLVASGLQLGRTVYGSPTLSDKALMPFPALKMGPGDSSRSHTADEYIYVSEVKEGIDIYIQLLEALL
jgi:acetylornithine deacetylase